jgi:uncharacterized membrane protein YccC
MADIDGPSFDEGREQGGSGDAVGAPGGRPTNSQRLSPLARTARRAAGSISETIRSGFSSATGLRRSALFNGLAVGLGVGLTAAVGDGFFPAQALAIVLGAISISIVDTPTSLAEKAKRMSFACALSTLCMGAAAAAAANNLAEAAVVLAAGFCAGMATAYGRNAIPISVSALLALVFARSVVSPQNTALQTTGWFALGGVAFAVYAILVTPLLASQTKRMLLREALDALSAFLRAQSAALIELRDFRSAYELVIDGQAALAERIQAARDVAFVNVATEKDRLYAALLISVIDMFEAAVSEQADLDALLQLHEAHREPLQILHELLQLAASDLDRFSRAFAQTGRGRDMAFVERKALLAQLAAREWTCEPSARPAIRATGAKVDLLFAQIDRMWDVRDDAASAAKAIEGIDLDHFVQKTIFDLRTPISQLRLQAPVARFAIRLSLALFCGCLLGEVLPNRAHGTWILLTVALVMRANYSITRQRRYERVLGNVFGCLVSAVILVVAPAWLLPLVMFLAVALSQAFAVQSYFVSSIASCVTALALIHVAEPTSGAFFLLMRVVDTALGAAIAYLFSFVLPTWEHKMIAAQIFDLVRVARDYAQLALSPDADDQAYRMARRQIYDGTASLATAAHRILVEPAGGNTESQALSGFLAASYSLIAEMASIHLHLRSRREPNPELEAALATARRLISAALERAGEEQGIRPSEGEQDFSGAGALARRLSRAVAASARLAALSSQAGSAATARAQKAAMKG